VNLSIRIVKDTSNPLLDRREIVFEVMHPQQPTPSRRELRERLAAEVGADPELTYIVKAETKTNSWTTLGVAHIYKSLERAKLIVPEHILIRDNPELTERKPRKEER